MKTNHARGDQDTQHYHDRNDPWQFKDYNAGHQGASRVRKGVKKAARTAQRRFAQVIIQDQLDDATGLRMTSTVEAFVRPDGNNKKRSRGI